MIDGKVDALPKEYGLRHELFKYVDFTFVTGYYNIRIIQANKSRQVFKAVFDSISYQFMMLVIIIIGVILWMLQFKENKFGRGYLLAYSLLLSVSSLLKQELPKRVGSKSKLRGIIFCLLILTTFVSTMFSSVIISILTKMGDIEVIDRMEDLKKFPLTKIYVNDNFEILLKWFW